MEIEAKFALPDEETFQRLRAADHLAAFALSTGRVKEVRDTYLDTAGRLILAAGYACRRRVHAAGTGDQVTMTLKGLGGAAGAVHRREELEVTLPADQPPAEWPASPVRDRVLQLAGEASLLPLFELQQARTVRLVTGGGHLGGERRVAEWSLDDVHVFAGGREQAYFELEVELAPEGTEDDLAAIVACLQDEWGLVPEPRSKFERALEFAAVPLPQGGLLAPQERAVCQQIATRDDMYGRRARALLALDEGVTQKEAGERATMSDRRVRHWLAAFRRRRLDIFPARVLDTTTRAPTPSGTEPSGTDAAQPEVLPEPELQPGAEDLPQPLTLEALFDRYTVDRTHARTVADHALALFDHLLPFHSLPPERRSLLETAALVHNVGVETDPDRHHVVGRDILLAHPPAGLDECERQMVALTTFLHRKRITRKRLANLAESAFAELPEPAQAETLALAALIRMADGLDYSQTGTGASRLGQVRQREGIVEMEVLGPYAAVDAEQAQAKSDLWRLLFDIDVRFEPVLPVEPGGTVPFLGVPERPSELVVSELPDKPGLEADDSMAEAARKTLLFHFQRMLYHEPGTRLGADIEELHDMRVATRRMRAAIPVFGDYLAMDEMRPFVKGLRRTGRVLGAVRDLDVFWEKTRCYLDKLPSEQQSGLDPLRAVWEAERKEARERMLAYLDGDRYARFVERFGEFLQTPGAGALPVILEGGEPLPHRLCHVVPAAVYQRLAAVWAYDEWVTGPDVPLARLHQLRIAAKGLRYTLEFFREVLGPEAKSLIKEIKGLQDHLGDLQDAVVASNLLRDFLTWGTWGHRDVEAKHVPLPTVPIVAPGVAAYLTARQVELQRLLDTFPGAWAHIQSLDFRHWVAAALAAL
jgi:CHAD domain-containing protein